MKLMVMKGELLVLGWGGTYGAITEAVIRCQKTVIKYHKLILNILIHFPKNTGEVLRRFKKILIPEINLGQLAKIIRSEFLIPVDSI